MTSYKIAENAMEYRKAHELIKSEGVVDMPLNFPTILAFDGEEVVGVLGTDVSSGYIVAGPLVLKSDKKRTFTIIRLVEAYDYAMRSAGVKSFIFSTALENKKWLEYIDTVLECKPYCYKDGRAWFVRKLEG